MEVRKKRQKRNTGFKKGRAIRNNYSYIVIWDYDEIPTVRLLQLAPRTLICNSLVLLFLSVVCDVRYRISASLMDIGKDYLIGALHKFTQEAAGEHRYLTSLFFFSRKIAGRSYYRVNV